MSLILLQDKHAKLTCTLWSVVGHPEDAHLLTDKSPPVPEVDVQRTLVFTPHTQILLKKQIT